MPRKKVAAGPAEDLLGPVPAKPKKPMPPVTQIFDAHTRLYVQKTGVQPLVKYTGQDARQMKTLVDSVGVDRVLELLVQFFSGVDPWALRSGWTIGAFYTVAQRLHAQRGRVIDQRTAENMDAAMRATQRRRT